MKRIEADTAYNEMKMAGMSFEDSAADVCKNFGIPKSLATVYADAMLYEVRQVLTTFDFGPSHLVSGNIPEEQRDRVRQLRSAMEKSSKGKRKLAELGMSDDDVIPVPAVLGIDDDGYFLTPRYRLDASDSSIQAELNSLRTRALAAAQRKFLKSK